MSVRSGFILHGGFWDKIPPFSESESGKPGIENGCRRSKFFLAFLEQDFRQWRTGTNSDCKLQAKTDEEFANYFLELKQRAQKSLSKLER